MKVEKFDEDKRTERKKNRRMKTDRSNERKDRDKLQELGEALTDDEDYGSQPSEQLPMDSEDIRNTADNDQLMQLDNHIPITDSEQLQQMFNEVILDDQIPRETEIISNRSGPIDVGSQNLAVNRDNSPEKRSKGKQKSRKRNNSGKLTALSNPAKMKKISWSELSRDGTAINLKPEGTETRTIEIDFDSRYAANLYVYPKGCDFR